MRSLTKGTHQMHISNYESSPVKMIMFLKINMIKFYPTTAQSVFLICLWMTIIKNNLPRLLPAIQGSDLTIGASSGASSSSSESPTSTTSFCTLSAPLVTFWIRSAFWTDWKSKYLDHQTKRGHFSFHTCSRILMLEHVIRKMNTVKESFLLQFLSNLIER